MISPDVQKSLKLMGLEVEKSLNWNLVQKNTLKGCNVAVR